MDELTLRTQLNSLEALRSSLHSSLRFWEWMVVVGLIIDLIVIAKEFWDGWQDSRQGVIHPPARPSVWLLVLSLFGTGLIAFGIARELSVDSKIEGVETRVRGVNEQLFGIVSTEAENAATSSETARNEADAVDSEAHAIRGRLDGASRQLSEIESDVLAEGPRWRLLERGKDVFIKSLKPFGGQRVTLVICGNEDTERSGFEQVLINMLREAGWDSPGYVRWSECPNMLSGGNEIYFVSATDDSAEWTDVPAQQWAKVEGGRFNISHDASNTLADVLYKLGIFTIAWRQKPLPVEVGIGKARSFFAFGAPNGPAEMAYKDPGRIFILIGPNAPMFANRSNHAGKNAKPQ